MLQLGFGKSAFQSGLITFSAAVGSVVAKAIARPVLRRFGYRDTLIWNSVVCTAYFGICAFFRPDWPLMLIYAVLIVGGCFRSLQFTGYGTLCYADIPPERTGAAIGFHSTMQQVSVTLGVAISATILSASAALSGHPGPLLEDFTLTMLMMASLCLAGVYFASLLPEDAAAELSGHRRVSGEVEKAELPAQSR
jgi:MFS family permease